MLFLGNLKKKPARASWDELQDALSSKHPDISKTKLRKIVNANKVMFDVMNGSVQLSQLNHDFVQEYFKLAEGVEVITHHTESSYSRLEPCHFRFGNSILVTGIVCAFSCSSQGEAVLFKFGGKTAYRLENTLNYNYYGGQKLISAIRIRKDVKRNSYSYFATILCTS